MSIMACSRVVPLVVTFAIFIFTAQILTTFLEVSDHIRSVQNYNRFLVYLTIYRPIEILKFKSAILADLKFLQVKGYIYKTVSV